MVAWLVAHHHHACTKHKQATINAMLRMIVHDHSMIIANGDGTRHCAPHCSSLASVVAARQPTNQPGISIHHHHQQHDNRPHKTWSARVTKISVDCARARHMVNGNGCERARAARARDALARSGHFIHDSTTTTMVWPIIIITMAMAFSHGIPLDSDRVDMHAAATSLPPSGN